MRHVACLTALAVASATLHTSDPAQACGGCFSPPSENTVVTGHRMAMSMSPDQTVLWDQIQYTGDPADFSWVLPVKPGARLELASDALFDVLDSATSTAIVEPQVFCNMWGGDGYDYGDYEGSGSRGFGFGCGSASDEASSMDAYGSSGATSGTGGYVPPPPAVEVVHQGTVGPYETVTLSTNIAGALNDWLDQHGYSVPDDIQPVIDAYVAEGFDFIALRLSPDVGVGAMKPVRIVSPGASFALPLRMVAAGTGANTAMTLFLLGEGRYGTSNFPSEVVPHESISWDFADSSSNYAELRLDVLGRFDGRMWATTYARRGSLFEPIVDPLVPNMPPNVLYSVSNRGAYETIAEAYFQQGEANGETDTSGCGFYGELIDFNGRVVDNCDEQGTCTTLAFDETSDERFKCNGLTDLATALLGLHPSDVWITRMEANLPRAALVEDLQIEAAAEQSFVENRVFAAQHENHPCDQQASIAPSSRNRSMRIPGGPVAITLFAAGLFWCYRRRRLAASFPG